MVPGEQFSSCEIWGTFKAMTAVQSTKERGIWICSRRGTWARAVAVVLRLLSDRQITILASLDAGEISAEIQKNSVVARPWPEDICILDLSLSSAGAAAQLLDIYHRLRDEAFWIGPCILLAMPDESERLRQTSIVPDGACFADLPSIHRFLNEPLRVADLLITLREIGQKTLEPSEWAAIIDASPTLRRLAEQFAVFEAAMASSSDHDTKVREARRLSKIAGGLCCECEFWHGSVYDACRRIQAFLKGVSVSHEQLRQFLEDVRLILNVRWRICDDSGETSDPGRGRRRRVAVGTLQDVQGHPG